MGAIKLLPVSEEENGKNGVKRTFSLSNTAVFKDLKLVDYLDAEDTQLMQWLTGKLKKGTLSVFYQSTKESSA